MLGHTQQKMLHEVALIGNVHWDDFFESLLIVLRRLLPTPV